jgi:transposase
MSKKPKEYIVQLTDEQSSRLLSLVNKGECNAHIIKRANVLLQSHQGKTAIEIASVLNTSQQTVYNICKRFAKGGLDDALYDKPRPGAKRRLQFE